MTPYLKRPAITVGAARARSGFPQSQLLAGVEVVIRAIGALDFVVRVRRVAGGGWWWLPALGMNPLDAGDPTKHAISRVSGSGQKQPGNRVGGGRIHPRHSLSCHLAAIVMLPGRAGEMTRDYLSFGVAKLRVRSFEHPRGPAIGSRLTRIYLESRGMCLKQQFLRTGNLDLIGDIGPRGILCARQRQTCKH